TVSGYGNITDTLNLNNNATLLALTSNASSNIYVENLVMNGGVINTNTTINSLSQLDNPIFNVGNLSNIGSSVTLLIDLNTSILDTNISNPNSTNLYDYGNTNTTVQHQVVNASNVLAGNGSQVDIKHLNGSVSNDTVTLGLYDNLDQIGNATFGVTATMMDNGTSAGIYIGYGLKEIEAFANKTVTLYSENATGNILNAKLSGEGGFTFTGSNATYVGNAASNYTGNTLLADNANITALSSNAFGNTENLTLEANTTFNLGNYSQIVNNTINNDGVINIDNGILTSNTLNNTNILNVKTGTISIANYFDTNETSLNGTLNISSVALLNGTLSGTGVVNANTSTFIVDSNNSNFSGTLNLNSGVLILGFSNTTSSSIGGDVNAASGTVVQGYGSIGNNLTLESGSKLFLGDNITNYSTTMTVGNVTFKTGSLLEIYADENNTYSTLTVADSATIENGVTLILNADANWSLNKNYTIISTGSGVSGNFSSITSNFLYVRPETVTDYYNVYLILTRISNTFKNDNLTYNQNSVAGALDTAKDSTIGNTILTMSEANVRNALDSLSGEIYASTNTILFTNANFLRKVVLSHMIYNNSTCYNNEDGATICNNNKDIEYKDWISLWGRDTNIDSNNNYADVDSNSFGFLVGLDNLQYDNTLFGIALGYEKTKIRVDNRYSKNNMDTMHLSIYANKEYKPLSIRGGLGYSFSVADVNRDIPFMSESAKAKYHAQLAQVFTEVYKPISISKEATITPYLQLAYMYLYTNSFTESDATYSNLKVKGRDDQVLLSTLGLRSIYDITQQLSLELNLGWQYAALDIRGESDNRFATGSDTFNIRGGSLGRNSGIVDLGIIYNLTSDLYFNLIYKGELTRKLQEHSTTFRVNYRF
ncbi:MAG: autotransporter domain-containing protein, partial [Campylobacteraceae bacterium]